MTDASASDRVDPLGAFRLDDKVAVVTGASSGIGSRFARVLDAAGAKVVLAARRAERLEALAKELTDAVAVPCDVADDASCEALVAAAVDRYGTVDVLVNNAGISDVFPAESEPMEEFRRTIAVNLTGPFKLCQLSGQRMLEQGRGSIVNVASMLGLVGTGQIPQAGYNASKAGLINMSRELGAQWARRGVRVNAICPGWFPTEMTAEMFADAGGQQWIRRRTPMGRGGQDHELDGALLFLASDASSYVTGQTLVVDGGWTAI